MTASGSPTDSVRIAMTTLKGSQPDVTAPPTEGEAGRAKSPSLSESVTAQKALLRRGSNGYSPSGGGGGGGGGSELESTGGPPRGLRYVLIILTCSLFVFLVALNQAVLAASVPALTNTWTYSTSYAGWYGSAYMLTATVFFPVFTRHYVSFGVKGVYLFSFLIFEAGALIGSFAGHPAMLIAGRAMSGLGMAGGYSGSLLIVCSIPGPPEKRRLLASILNIVYVFGTLFGVVLSGAVLSGSMVQGATWRWGLWIDLFFLPPLLFLIIFVIRLPPHNVHQATWIQRAAQIDWLGALFALGSLICLLAGLQKTQPNTSASLGLKIGLLVGFLLLAVAFGINQHLMGDRALLPPILFRNRSVAFGCIVSFLIGAVIMTLLYWIPAFFELARGTSPGQAVLNTLSYLLSALISAIAVSVGVAKFEVQIPVLAAGTLILSIGCGILSTFDASMGMSSWTGLQVLAGIGSGISWMLPSIAVTRVLAIDDFALGNSIVLFFHFLGATIFLSVFENVFASTFFRLLYNLVTQAESDAIKRLGWTNLAQATVLGTQSVVQAAGGAIGTMFFGTAIMAGAACLAVFGMHFRPALVRARLTGSSASSV
ncbi:hypothetical protein OC844_007598 [Tilletia horrida]|nr:hypothetical protein OC844_007598 [Tilletia horrida]